MESAIWPLTDARTPRLHCTAQAMTELSFLEATNEHKNKRVEEIQLPTSSKATWIFSGPPPPHTHRTTPRVIRETCSSLPQSFRLPPAPPALALALNPHRPCKQHVGILTLRSTGQHDALVSSPIQWVKAVTPGRELDSRFFNPPPPFLAGNFPPENIKNNEVVISFYPPGFPLPCMQRVY